MGRENNSKGWYPPELKKRAIALARDIGANNAGPKLGIAADTLRVWIWLEENGNKMSKQDTPEERALKLAQREVQKLKKENEELKKANFVLKAVSSFFPNDRLDSNSRRSKKSRNGKKPQK
jgi:transposase-like protein